MATMVADDKEGNGEGSKSNGNGNKEGNGDRQQQHGLHNQEVSCPLEVELYHFDTGSLVGIGIDLPYLFIEERSCQFL
jgi:hypothetical protein